MKTFKTYLKNPIHTYMYFQAFEALRNCIKKVHTHKQKVKEYVPIFFDKTLHNLKIITH
jgi:hypothetical protein